MRTNEIEEMKRLSLFAGIADAEVEAMLRDAYLQRFPGHVDLIREGDPADFLHVVVDGQVEIFAGYRDRETTVSVLGPGDSFIIAAVILDKVYLKSARALTPARVLLIPAELVRRAFEQDGVFARRMTIELAHAYRRVVRELKNQKLRSSLERLANWILAEDKRMGGHRRIELPFDKKVLASRLGMAPEVLSRSFNALAAYKVEVVGPCIRIQDLDALIALAHPSVTIDEDAD
jgi:CRP/FNR family transcriptional activator FtrB